MKREKGMAILMMTSVLMLIALLMSLTYSQTVFYQIKRIHNEIKERQKYWIVEGGVECIYSQSRRDTLSIQPELTCGLPPNLVLVIESEKELIYKAHVEYDGISNNKYFYFPSLTETRPVWIKGSWHDFQP